MARKRKSDEEQTQETVDIEKEAAGGADAKRGPLTPERVQQTIAGTHAMIRVMREKRDALVLSNRADLLAIDSLTIDPETQTELLRLRAEIELAEARIGQLEALRGELEDERLMQAYRAVLRKRYEMHRRMAQIDEQVEALRQQLDELLAEHQDLRDHLPGAHHEMRRELSRRLDDFAKIQQALDKEFHVEGYT